MSKGQTTHTFTAEAMAGVKRLADQLRDTPPLSDDFSPDRYSKSTTREDLGWCQITRTSKYDRDSGEITSRSTVVDLDPHSGVILDVLEHKAMLLDLDQVVARLDHTDELARQIKKRRSHLMDRLKDIVGGAKLVQGQVSEAGWKQEAALYYGPKQNEDNQREQGRLRDEADQCL